MCTHIKGVWKKKSNLCRCLFYSFELKPYSTNSEILMLTMSGHFLIENLNYKGFPTFSPSTYRVVTNYWFEPNIVNHRKT